MRRSWTALVWCLALALGNGAVEGAGVPLTDLDTCDALVRDRSEDLDAYRCYWIVARRDVVWDDAFARVESLLEVDPDNPRVLFVLGGMAADRGQDRAERLFREAADRFANENHARGEVQARVSLGAYVCDRGRLEEGRVEAERALEVAERSGNPHLTGEVNLSLGWQSFREHDYGSALAHMNEAERLLLPDGPLRLRINVSNGLGAVSWSLMRFREALDHYERAATLVRGQDAFQESTIRRNAALVAERLRMNDQITEGELIALQRAALDAAVLAGNRYAEVGARLMLATSIRDEEGLVEAERALGLARELGRVDDLYWALWLTAEKISRLHPERSERAVELADEAIEMATNSGDPRALATGLNVRHAVRWDAGLWEESIEDGFAALDAIERIRDLQPDTEVRARVTGRFAGSYYRLAATLLGPSGKPVPEARVEAVLGVMERFRARSLLEILDAAGATIDLTPPGGAAEERMRVLTAIGAILTELPRADLTREERDERLHELDRLERRERALRAELALESPAFGAVRMPAVPNLADLREALDADQALLYYLSDNTPEDSPLDHSRLLALSRDRVSVYTLPERSALDREIGVYRALLERRDDSEVRGAVRLYEELLAGAVNDLPDGVDRLVIVPDGPLHRLPFGTLRSSESAEPVAARFEIFLVPSVTVWMRWKQGSELPAGAALVAFADPLLDDDTGTGELREGGEGAAPVPTGRLPHARREAAALLRYLGDDGRLLTGAGATEHALKTADLTSARIVHFAAHAVVDDDRPERSAVLLAPGTADEDGRLGFREVTSLDLDGQAVILSACRSGSGPVVGGEGVMGLANAFFQAGARTVVAGLWAVRDRETARLIERFGRYLGEGESVATALARSRRELIRRGAPSAAWAGMVVLGDGDLVPLPEGRSSSWSRSRLVPLLVAGLAVGAMLGLGYRRGWLSKG